MEQIKEIAYVLYENIQWIFSGIGVTVLSILGGKEILKRIKGKQKAKDQAVNISSTNDINSENIITQTAGTNSRNLQVMGDYHEGISYSDARQVALDVFKANATYVVTDIAKKIIRDRASEITDDIFTVIYRELPNKINKLVEPAVQEALIKVQKAYAKNNSQELKIQLIELMKQRMNVEESDLEQIILDEAIEIIPKLSNIQLDVLSLHLAVLRINRNSVGNRNAFFKDVSTRILPFFSNEMKKDMVYAHLQYVGCTGILSEGSTYKPIEEIYRNNCGGLFSKGFEKVEFDQYMGLDTNMFRELLTNCQLDSNKLQFNALNESVLMYIIEKHGYEKYKDKLVKYYRQHVMTVEEVKNDISENVEGFDELAEFWKESREFKAMKLTSVGIAIGILNYNLKTGSEIKLVDFI